MSPTTWLTSWLFLCSLLQQLVELRNDLSRLLTADVKEHKLRQQEAQSLRDRDVVDTGRRAAHLVNGGLPAIHAVDADVSDWLNDCADADTIQKVELLHHLHCKWQFECCKFKIGHIIIKEQGTKPFEVCIN